MKISQGQIIRAEVLDMQGQNPKVRPLVVVSPQDETSPLIVTVAITGVINNSPDEVPLPWHRDGTSRTRLRKPSVANCRWRPVVKREDVVEIKGAVANTKLLEILKVMQRIDE